MANVHGLGDVKKSNPSGGRGGGPPGGNPGGDGGFPFPNFFGGGGGGRPNSDDGKVISVHSESEFNDHLRKAGGKLVVVDFTASWCGPCKMIAPAVAALSNKYPNVVFLKVDVDDLREVAQSCGIRSMPTFQFYKNGNKIDEFSGADASKLQSTVEKHMTAATSAPESSASSGGYTLGSGSGRSNLLDRFANPSNAPAPTASSTPSFLSPLPSEEELLRQTLGGRSVRDEPSSSSGSGSASSDTDAFFVNQLLEMGFSDSIARRAVRATGGKSIEDAVDWCAAHMDDEPTASEPSSTPAPASSTPAVTSTPSDNASAAPSDAPKPEGDATPMDAQPTSQGPFDSAQTVHNAFCDVCKQKIVGMRWKCSTCSDYDLCSNCYRTRTHNAQHLFDAYEFDIADPVKKPLTSEELAERTRLYAEKAKQIREKKAREEEMYKRESEKNRVKQGKEAQEIKKTFEEKQKERERFLAKKEKEEARIAKEKIMKKIEQDKREREAARAQASGSDGSVSQPTMPSAMVSASQPASQPEKKDYTESLIQFRTPDGVLLKATFKPTDTIRTVHSHIALLLGNDRVTLSTTYPRKTYSPNGPEMNETLTQAQCVPSGTFIVR